ncbi:MAG: ABC transporter ATP-binding protein [Patescibacteria group bacterium]|nr:ABC transporter ATP-binding protein [Patescibacteria group bacterium]
MLKIQNLKAGYNGMEILRGIDLEVNSGEIVAIIGPNGAGKSTLLKSIFNLCQIYSGKIIFKNKELTRLPTYQLISLGISYVPQGRQVFSNMTVRENLEMGGYAIKSEIRNPNFQIPTSSRILDYIGTNSKFKITNSKKISVENLLNEKVYKFFPILKEREKELASSLSGGEQQMLAIGRALVQTPELLLLDEPSLGLAPKVQKEVFGKIQEINKQGVAIIIVEQNAKKAVEIAQRTYILEDGKIALEGGKEILENEKIKNIYFGGR